MVYAHDIPRVTIGELDTILAFTTLRYGWLLLAIVFFIVCLVQWKGAAGALLSKVKNNTSSDSVSGTKASFLGTFTSKKVRRFLLLSKVWIIWKLLIPSNLVTFTFYSYVKLQFLIFMSYIHIIHLLFRNKQIFKIRNQITIL